MAEELYIQKGSKEEKYKSLLPQIKGLVEGEDDLIANMANISAALFQQFGWLWVGFYIVKNDQLILGPFQGPIACTRIPKGKGVCGTSWAEKRTIIVPNVNDFPGHIACSSISQSEIVVPIGDKESVYAVLDIDSEQLNQFDEVDQLYLEQIVKFLNF